jgi:hypothetical protein
VAAIGGATLLASGIPQTKTDAILFLFSCFGFSFGCYYVLAFIPKRSFPKLLFNLGKSAEQVRAAVIWRQVFFVGFLLAIVTSIIAAIIMNQLKS